MKCSDRGTIEPYEAATLEHPVDDRLSEVFVVQDAAPRLQRFVRREDHGPVATMPFVDDVKEHVGRISAVREVAHFIDHQDGGMRIGLQGLCELPLTKGRGEIIDEGRGRREERVKAVLDGAIRDGDRQVRFPTP
jgi:hypothetical protein